MKSRHLRDKFLRYFESQEHQIIASSPLIPQDDPTLLFANAGMNQFKNLFLGLEKRAYSRAATSQKCVRAGGKHNDLENVGFTARHHTFFEMLGNFSFGDYFKKEAIFYAWEFLTKKLELPTDRLYVTVFETDDEAAEIWRTHIGVPSDHIFRFGEKDNFWRMGDIGPCGPCSEIFYDHGPKAKKNPGKDFVGGETDRFVEIWNLVFMQFYEDGSGVLKKLPKPSVDTGAGLERLSAVVQGKISNYDTDLFQPLIELISKKTNKIYIPYAEEKESDSLDDSISMKVIADHARAIAFLLGDHVSPSNEGRGYVLRRILRRALRYGRKLDPSTSLLPLVVEKVIDEMGDIYPELIKNKKQIIATTAHEEEKFLHTLDQGTHLLKEELKKVSSSHKKISGEVAFKLYDTFGFPIDLTCLMASENGYQVELEEFQKLMMLAKQKARSSWKGSLHLENEIHFMEFQKILENQPTEFIGYKNLNTQSKLLLLSDGEKLVASLKTDQLGIAIFDQTPFYAESGGQVGDRGIMISSKGRAEILDCKKFNSLHLHHLKVTDGQLETGDLCQLKVDSQIRLKTAANHTATHLLHSALRNVLGDKVTQAGSLVNDDKIRFDFSFNKAMAADEIEKVEKYVNKYISSAHNVNISEHDFPTAKKMGALALFGEKYGDLVRVVKVDNVSTELCGGTHIENTSMIRLFKIVSESSVSSGVRRIEALTHDEALDYLEKHAKENLVTRKVIGFQENWGQFLEKTTSHQSVPLWIEEKKNQIKDLQKEIQKYKLHQIDIEKILNSSKKIAQIDFITWTLPTDERKILLEISDKIKDRLTSGIILLLGQSDEILPLPVLISITKKLAQQISAASLLKEVTQIMGGKGGGRNDLAQGSVNQIKNLPQAINEIEKQISKQMGS